MPGGTRQSSTAAGLRVRGRQPLQHSESDEQCGRVHESEAGYERLGEIWETQQAEHAEDWLLSMEIFEILDTTDQQPELKARIEKFLNGKKASTKDLSTLIGWGFRLVEYHKRPEDQETLHASPK